MHIAPSSSRIAPTGGSRRRNETNGGARRRLMVTTALVAALTATGCANLGGGLLMGFALGLIQAWPAMTPALKLLLTTGLLGGLTTFSTFSAEAFHLLQRGAIGWLGLHVTLHVMGSVLMTWAGYSIFNMLRT